GCAVGAPFAVLIAEEVFASGCRFLLSLTSAGQNTPCGPPPYFFFIDRALRDEGTSYHYASPSENADAGARLVARAAAALEQSKQPFFVGATWTTDAPFRETTAAIEAARSKGHLAVEMEAAALYAFARASGAAVLCLAHVTNSMGQAGRDFEKGEADGTANALAVLEALVAMLGRSWRSKARGPLAPPATTIVVQVLSSLDSSRLLAICTLSLRLPPRTTGQ